LPAFEHCCEFKGPSVHATQVRFAPQIGAFAFGHCPLVQHSWQVPSSQRLGLFAGQTHWPWALQTLPEAVQLVQAPALNPQF
jgi:hypothetical protein